MPKQQAAWQSLFDAWRHKEEAVFQAGEILDLTPWRDLWGFTPLFVVTNGRLYVREEYVTMYGRLVNAAASGARGVVVSGQPGIGKSFFGIYVLLRRLAEDKDVMYALGAQDDVVRFQSGTAYIIAEPREECKDHTGSPNDANRPWMLIEPGTSQSDHKLNIFLLHHSLYRVAFFAPGTSSTKSLLGHYLFHKWDMSLWTEDELVQLWSNRLLLLRSDSYGWFDAVGDVRAVVKHLVLQVGSCPRDIGLWVHYKRPGQNNRKSESST
ncbi:hypothetical protein C8Q76DRAFT_406596 [Earliella scabrosa]|nr:hypothetical protein C8Q76DRAFT_406596 [Earliella scabrosa]